MKNKLILATIAASLILQGYSQTGSNDYLTIPAKLSQTVVLGGFKYNLSVLNEPYAELTDAIPVNNGELWDDPDFLLPLDFPFELNDNLIVFLEFAGHGALLRSPTGGQGEYTFAIPFDTDLIDRGIIGGTSLSPISYKVEGEPGSRIFKLEIKNAGSKHEYTQLGTTNMYIHFQMWLYEYTDVVEFRYGESTIDDPFLFYANTGAVVGITDFNITDNSYTNPSLLQGPATAPELGDSILALDGTPSEGTVYRMTPVPPLSVMVTAINSTSSCAPNGSATAEATGGVPPYSYLWKNGDTTATRTGLDQGIYVVTVTDHEGSTKTGVAFITNVNPVYPYASTTTETEQDAHDGIATSVPSGGDPPYSFEWSNGETTQTIFNLTPATYTVTVTDNQGCTGTQSVIVNHFGCSEISLDVYVENASCAGICDAVISVSAHGGALPYTYEASEGTGGPGICAGTYYITVTDAEGCGEISSPILIVELYSLEVVSGSTKETAPFANDGTAWVIPVEGTAPFFYEWSNGSLDSLVTGLAPGSYSVTISDANGCTDTVTVMVEAFGCSSYTENFIQGEICLDSCSWSITTLLVNGVGPLDYSWSTGDTTIGIQHQCPGTYSLTVVDLGYNNCTYVEEFVIPSPDSVAGVVDTVLHYTDTGAGSIDITVTAGQPPYQFLWEGPNMYVSFEEDITGLSPGFYTVRITSYWGCTLIDSIEVRDLTVRANNVSNLDVRVYPNPAREQVYIELEEVSRFTFQLTSLEGHVIKTWDAEHILDVSEIPAGLYLLEGISGEGIFRKQISVVR